MRTTIAILLCWCGLNGCGNTSPSGPDAAQLDSGLLDAALPDAVADAPVDPWAATRTMI